MKTEKSLLFLLLVLIAVFSFIFSLIAIETSLHQHYQQIAWQSGKLFFDYYRTFSGGIGEYLALFISQLFKSNLLGSTIVALSGLLIPVFVFKTISIELVKTKLKFLLIPLIQIVILALMCDYSFRFSVTVNLILVSGFLNLCTLIDKYSRFKIKFHTIFAGILLYYLSGGMYFLIFMVSSLILLLKKPDLKLLFNALLFIAISFLIPYVAYRFVFVTSLNNSFFRSTPDVAAMIRYTRPPIFYVSLAAIPFVMFLSKIVAMIPVSKENLKTFKKNGDNSINKNKPEILVKKGANKIEIAIQLMVLTVVSGFISY